jgi:hypothetical protein
MALVGDIGLQRTGEAREASPRPFDAVALTNVMKSLVFNEVEDIEARACCALEFKNSARRHFGRCLVGRPLHSAQRVAPDSLDPWRCARSPDGWVYGVPDRALATARSPSMMRTLDTSTANTL